MQEVSGLEDQGYDFNVGDQPSVEELVSVVDGTQDVSSLCLGFGGSYHQ